MRGRELTSPPASDESCSDPSVLPGEILDGKYRIERVLGRGGMGVVLAARNLELDELVAIKVLGRVHTLDIASRFIGEARAAARIRSEHVVRIFDVGRTEDLAPYIVMEHLEGQDLSAVIETSGAVPPAAAVRWVLEACEALAEAHKQGIVHRDLKPANLFLARRADGSTRIKLLDFGIAKLPSSLGLTNTKNLMGSPVYMPPEQLASSRNVDARADIWGLGAVLYEALTAQPPFFAESVLELAVKVRDEPHVSAAAFRPEVPAELSAIVDRCLAKQREDRWPSVAALAVALKPFAPDEAKGLVARIERIAAGADSNATLDVGGSRVHSEIAATLRAPTPRNPTLEAVSTSMGPGTQTVARKHLVVRGAIGLGAVAVVATIVTAAWRPSSSAPSPSAPATSAATISMTRSEALSPPASRAVGPAVSVVTHAVRPALSVATSAEPAPRPERGRDAVARSAGNRRRTASSPASEAPAASDRSNIPPASKTVMPAEPSAPSRAPQPAPSETKDPKRGIDRSEPW